MAMVGTCAAPRSIDLRESDYSVGGIVREISSRGIGGVLATAARAKL